MDDQLKRRLVGVSALLLVALLISLLLPSPGKPPTGEDGLKRVTLDLSQSASAATVTQAAPPSTPVPPVIAAAPPSGATAESDEAPQFDEPSSDAAGDSSMSVGAVTTAPKPVKPPAVAKAGITVQHPPAVVATAPAKPAIAAAVVPQQQASKPAKSMTNMQPGAEQSAWFVQAGTFSEVDNARRLAAKLKDGGYAAIVSPAETHAGVGYRVRVGPYRNREQAETAQKGLTHLGVSHAALIGE